MNTVMFIIVTALNMISLLVFVVVNKETKRIAQTHIDLIQKVNTALVETGALKIARFAYFISLVILTVITYLLSFTWML